jgi:hypothetical protein
VEALRMDIREILGLKPTGIACWLVLAALGLLRYSVHHTATAAIAEARAAGCPIKLDELETMYVPVPPEENAAEIYRKAWEAYGDPGEEVHWLPFYSPGKKLCVGKPIPDDLRGVIARFLSGNTNTFELLHQAAALSKCRYPIKLEDGMEMEVPHLPKLRACTRLLALKASLCAEMGDAEKAVETLEDAVAVGESLRYEPYLIGQLARINCRDIVFGGLEQVISRTTLSANQLDTLSNVFRQAADLKPVEQGLRAETCSILEGMSKLAPLNPFKAKDLSHPLSKAEELSFWRKGLHLIYRIPFSCYRWSGILDLDKTTMVRGISKLLSAESDPFPDRLNTSERLEKYYQGLFTRCSPASRTLLPALARAVGTEARFAAGIRLASVALAVEKYRVERNLIPEQLAALVPEFLPEVPTDPFDGASLRYRKTDTGYILYSVGRNRCDDGGQEGSWKDRTGDIVFTVANLSTDAHG